MQKILILKLLSFVTIVQIQAQVPQISLTTEPGKSIDIPEMISGVNNVYFSHDHMTNSNKQFKISSEGSFDAKANERINIYPGFLTERGGDFRAKIEDIDNCIILDEEVRDFKLFSPDIVIDSRSVNFKIISDKKNSYVNIWEVGKSIFFELKNCNSKKVLVTENAFTYDDLPGQKFLNKMSLYDNYRFSAEMNENGNFVIGFFTKNISVEHQFEYIVKVYNSKGELTFSKVVWSAYHTGNEDDWEDQELMHFNYNDESFAVDIDKNNDVFICRLNRTDNIRNCSLYVYKIRHDFNEIINFKKTKIFEYFGNGNSLVVRQIETNENGLILINYSADKSHWNKNARSVIPIFALYDYSNNTLIDDIGAALNIATAADLKEKRKYINPSTIGLGYFPGTSNFYISYIRSELKSFWHVVDPNNRDLIDEDLEYVKNEAVYIENISVEFTKDIEIIMEHDINIPSITKIVGEEGDENPISPEFASTSLSIDGRYLHVVSPKKQYPYEKTHPSVESVAIGVYEFSSQQFVSEKEIFFHKEELDENVIHIVPLQNCQSVISGYELDKDGVFSSKVFSTGLCNTNMNSSIARLGNFSNSDEQEEQLFSEESTEIDGLNALTIYPNPSTGNFTLELPFETSSHVIITDIVGKVVFQEILNEGSHDINLSEYNTGLYMIRVQNGDAIHVSKLLIE